MNTYNCGNFNNACSNFCDANNAQNNNKWCPNNTPNQACNQGNPSNPLASWFFSMSPLQLSTISSLLGLLLVDNLTSAQQAQLASFILNMGTTLLTYAEQQAALEEQNKQNDISRQLDIIKKHIRELEKELK